MKKKLNFRNDYSQIAHKDILNALIKHEDDASAGYGLDEYSKRAAQLIKNHLKSSVDIHFLIGGTSANKIVIASILKSYQAVISTNTGHINVHETGAIEACGHKILLVPEVDGKILPETVEKVMKEHVDEHMVMPKLVYISNATELGTVYSKQELINLYQMCKKWGLYLFIDGARLGVALTTASNDLTLDDIASNCDVFYIGGTKNGLMFGEAVVIVNDDLKKDFRYHIKQQGGLLAKGFITGLQFLYLFNDNLFFKLGKHANKMAEQLRKGLASLKIKLVSSSNTNQIFIMLKNELIKELSDKCTFEEWSTVDGEQKIIRLVTSWATTEKEVQDLLSWFKKKLHSN